MTKPAVQDSAAPSRAPKDGAGEDAFLAIVSNLCLYHREHEKYYAEAPLVDAITLQRIARTLMALAERWETVTPGAAPLPSPFAGASDLNDRRAIETSGVLFMEGTAEPAEITRMKADLRSAADSGDQISAWLAGAMEASWNMAEALLPYRELADLLGERHRIIANNWQNATTGQLVARHLRRAVSVIEQVDFSPAALREDMAGDRNAPKYLFAAAELINHAADLSASSSVLVHENERRWRIFRRRVAQLTTDLGEPAHEEGTSASVS